MRGRVEAEPLDRDLELEWRAPAPDGSRRSRRLGKRAARARAPGRRQAAGRDLDCVAVAVSAHERSFRNYSSMKRCPASQGRQCALRPTNAVSYVTESCARPHCRRRIGSRAVSLSMPVVWSDRHRLHEPGGEIWVGVRTPRHGAARARRADPRVAGGRRRAARRRPSPTATRRCSRFTTARCSTTSPGPGSEWARLGPDRGAGARTASSPTSSLTPGLLGDQRRARPAAIGARAGQLRLRHDDPDRARHLGGGARRRRRRADRRRPGARRRARRLRAAVARRGTTQPGPASAAPATSTTAPSPQPGFARRSAHRSRVIDVDAHHGNGTQTIFYGDSERAHRLGPRRSRRRLVSALPRLRGRDAARVRRAGANRNLCLAPGTGDEPWVERCRRALPSGLARAAPTALVVALGVDAAGGDPESPLEVSAEGFRAAGRLLGELGLPTVVVQEGGYDLERDRRAGRSRR